MCVSCESYKRRVLVEASLCELFEAFGEITSQCWRRRFGDVEEHSHWMHVGVRWFPLGELDSRDAQRPNIRLGGANNKTHLHVIDSDQSFKQTFCMFIGGLWLCKADILIPRQHSWFCILNNKLTETHEGIWIFFNLINDFKHSCDWLKIILAQLWYRNTGCTAINT